MLARNGRRAVGGAVINQENFEVGIIQPRQGIEAGRQCALAVIARHDNGYFWKFGEREIRRGEKCVLDGVKGWARLPSARGESHLPILDLASAPPPIVREVE